MRKKKSTAFQPFSISFLDCICCGFGAVILLFVLTSGKKSDYRQQKMSEVRINVETLQRDIDAESEILRSLAKILGDKTDILEELVSEREEVEDDLEKKKEELKLLLSENTDIEESLKKLLADMENLPTTDKERPLPLPNPVNPMVLTDFKTGGDRVLFLFEASGGMLDVDADLAIERIEDSNEQKRNAPKWQRVIRSIEWLMNTLEPSQTFQIYYFNIETESINKEAPDKWYDVTDQKEMERVLDNLHKVVPSGGANLERALIKIRQMVPPPDNIILLADGLPTAADSYATSSIVDQNDRLEMFNVAMKHLMIDIPINVILYPWAGDPPAASNFWRMAMVTKGSFICPERDWPNTQTMKKMKDARIRLGDGQKSIDPYDIKPEGESAEKDYPKNEDDYYYGE